MHKTVILDPGIASSLVDKGNQYTPEFEHIGDEISYNFRISDPHQYLKCVKRLAAKAVECDCLGVSFLVSTGVQIIYSFVRDRFPRNCIREIKKSDIERALAHIPGVELDALLDVFERKWFAEGDDRFSVIPSEMVQSLTPN